MLNFKAIAYQKAEYDNECDSRITLYQDSISNTIIHLETTNPKGEWVSWDDIPAFIEPVYFEAEIMGIIKFIAYLKKGGYTVTITKE